MFSKYLPSFGWRPIVLTRTFPKNDLKFKPLLNGITGLPPSKHIICVEMPSGSEAECGCGFLSKVKRFLKPEYGQTGILIEKMVEQFLQSEHSRNIAVIYATSPNLGQISTGVKLSSILKVPLIVDFRDIVEQDEHKGFRNRILLARHIIRRRFLTRHAFRAIAVSQQQKKILSRRLSVPVSVILNGYDEDIFKPSASVVSEVFTINYVGRIIEKSLRNPDVFFQALDLLLNGRDIDFNQVEVNFIGSEKDLVESMLENYACKSMVNIKARIDYDRVPKIIASSGINLVLTNKGRTGVLTTKFFEYLAVKKPILCVPNDNGSLDEIISNTKCGLSSSSPVEVAQYIKDIYCRWKDNEGRTAHCESILSGDYSRRGGAEKLAELLDSSCKID